MCGQWHGGAVWHCSEWRGARVWPGFIWEPWPWPTVSFVQPRWLHKQHCTGHWRAGTELWGCWGRWMVWGGRRGLVGRRGGRKLFYGGVGGGDRGERGSKHARGHLCPRVPWEHDWLGRKRHHLCSVCKWGQWRHCCSSVRGLPHPLSLPQPHSFPQW